MLINELKHSVKNQFSKKSVVKLTKVSVYFHEFLFNKANWWMSYESSPISAIFLDIYLNKMEHDVVVPAKSLFHNFYKRYVDDADAQEEKY